MEIKTIEYNGFKHSILKCESSDAAKKKAKQDFQGHCIFSNTEPKPLAGCHVFAAGSGKTSILKCYPINIIPLAYKFHTGHKDSLDDMSDPDSEDPNVLIERPPLERIELILERCHPDWLSMVRVRLELLQILAYRERVLT